MFIPYLDDLNSWWKQPHIYIFYGKSGSWKSTYAQYLSESINSIYHLHHYEEEIKFKKRKESWIYIDELVSFSHIITTIQYLIDGKKLILASHIHPHFFSILRIFYDIKSYNLNKIPLKIEQYLHKKNYTFSENAILIFVDIFGSNFTDLEIILQSVSHWSKNFDRILIDFLQTHSISYISSKKIKIGK